MIQEDKILLLTDLCARLPYAVIAHASEINKNGIITDINISYNMVNLTVDNTNGRYELVPLFDIKPYLRPMSSMTEEETEEYWTKINNNAPEMPLDEIPSIENIAKCSEIVLNWLNAHYFDYRGLIEKSLAIKAPEVMYKNK